MLIWVVIGILFYRYSEFFFEEVYEFWEVGFFFFFVEFYFIRSEVYVLYFGEVFCVVFFGVVNVRIEERCG